MDEWMILTTYTARELMYFSKLHRYIDPQVNYYLILTDCFTGITRLQAKKDNERRKELGVMDIF